MQLLSRAILVLALAAAPAAALAQSTRAGADAGPEQEVLALREKIRAAVVAKDRRTLNATFADNYMHLRDSGRVDLKPERIGLLLTGESTIETAPEENMNVQVYEPATVAVTGVSPIKDRQTGRSPRFRWLTVYVKQGDAWKVAVSQASRVTSLR